MPVAGDTYAVYRIADGQPRGIRLPSNRMLRAAALLAGLTLVLTGCSPAQSVSPASPKLPEGKTTRTTFISVVDGDTIITEAGTVRIIGIDTAERGECGYNEGSMGIGRHLRNGDPVNLVLPPGQNDTDRHDRLIRFVFTDTGVDIGLVQLTEGHAIARYDSTDGYPRHPLERAYHAAQIAKRAADGTVIPTVCDAAAPVPIAPPLDDEWWFQYPSCAQLKRNTVGHPTGPFSRNNAVEREIYDWFAFGTGNNGDGDGDGLACE